MVMNISHTFDLALTRAEQHLVDRLNSPERIQIFLDRLAYGEEIAYRSPLRVLRDRICQCFDGAVFGAAMLRRLGHAPLILNLLPNNRDDNHVLALYRQKGHWGAVAKSNFVGLRFREAVYRNLRELVMSYFELYYNVKREKTLRGYTRPLNLTSFDRDEWMIRDKTMNKIAERLDKLPRTALLTRQMVVRLSTVDKRSAQAGLLGANRAGLWTPPRMRHRR